MERVALELALRGGEAFGEVIVYPGLWPRAHPVSWSRSLSQAYAALGGLLPEAACL